MISRSDYKSASKSWDDEITLLGEETQTYDNDGFPVGMEPKETIVFTNRLPVNSSEFYQSNNQGFVISEAFEVHTIEYNGQQSLLFEGEEYLIRRTYRKDELTELYCERSDVNHG